MLTVLSHLLCDQVLVNEREHPSTWCCNAPMLAESTISGAFKAQGTCRVVPCREVCGTRCVHVAQGLCRIVSQGLCRAARGGGRGGGRGAWHGTQATLDDGLGWDGLLDDSGGGRGGPARGVQVSLAGRRGPQGAYRYVRECYAGGAQDACGQLWMCALCWHQVIPYICDHAGPGTWPQTRPWWWPRWWPQCLASYPSPP